MGRPPAHATRLPATAGPLANAMLRATSSRALASARAARGTRSDTRPGVATLKATVPMAPTKLSAASQPICNCELCKAASMSSRAMSRSTSPHSINCWRGMRSARVPIGSESSKNGRVPMAVSKPMSPTLLPSASTATNGTVARLSCSADWAARLARDSRTKRGKGGGEGDGFRCMAMGWLEGRNAVSLAPRPG